jgi:hypothetical protein
MTPDLDLLQEANMIFEILKVKSNSIKPIFHVKGHQDRKTLLHKLSWLAILNIKADKIVTEALLHGRLTSTNIEVTDNPIRLMIDNEIITSHELETLRWQWREFALQEYLESKFQLEKHEFHTINWAALQIARKKIPSTLIPFSVKLMIKWLPVGTRMEKYGHNMTMCYFCNKEEDFDHIFCCTKKQNQQHQLATELDNELQRIGMESSIRKALLMGTTEWMKKEATDTQENSMQAAIQQQQQIGWHRLICGLFGNEWARLKEQHQPKQMGDSWQASVCSFVIQKAHKFWTNRISILYNHDQKDKLTLGVPLEKCLAFAPATNKAWIIPTRREVIKRIKTRSDKFQSHQPDMRQFFTRKQKSNSEKLNETSEDIEDDIGNDMEVS